MSGDYIMKKLKESLILSFEDWMKKMGNIDYSIKNIEFFQYNGVQYAKAYISYTWYLHGWDKKVKEMLVIFIKSEHLGRIEWNYSS